MFEEILLSFIATLLVQGCFRWLLALSYLMYVWNVNSLVRKPAERLLRRSARPRSISIGGRCHENLSIMIRACKALSGPFHTDANYSREQFARTTCEWSQFSTNILHTDSSRSEVVSKIKTIRWPEQCTYLDFRNFASQIDARQPAIRWLILDLLISVFM